MRITIRLRLGIFVCGLLLSVAAMAQWPVTYPPADSPRWWTLTPEMSPQELRRVTLDRKAHQERFKETIQSNENRIVTREEMDMTRIFVDGSRTPSLVSMVEAFNALTEYLHGKKAQSEEVMYREILQRYGLSRAEIDLVIDAARLKNAEQERMTELTQEDTAEFVRILKETKENLGREKYRKALSGKKLGVLAKASGRSLDEVSRLSGVWDQDPVEDLLIETVAGLREELSEDGWKGFRSFLYCEIAPDILIVDFVTDTLE